MRTDCTCSHLPQMTNDITHEDSFSILIFFSLLFVMRLLDDDELLDVQR